MSTESPLLSNYDLKEEIREFWSSRAATFDLSPSHHINDLHGLPEWARLIGEAASLPPGGTLAGWSVLDVACGTGEISRTLRGLGAKATGVDFSEDMLAQARRKLAGTDWTGLHCDAETLSLLREDEFDMVVTRHLVWTLTDPAAAFAQWRRVLRPGGILLIVDGDWVSPASNRERLTRGILDRIAPPPEQDPNIVARNQSILPRLAYNKGLTPARLRADLAAQGFSDFRELSVKRLYRQGMRHLPLGQRLRQSLGVHRRFALVAR
ncbi:class I SAM-dependent methyltransferase [Rhodospirillum sp. A1_3_36]|uniref:class I SAM-dependent methyltransferase n=1 Tax=Rhodospirillum sp. A1_3_36 TaxID=3391666 RepID=UPI0039A69659